MNNLKKSILDRLEEGPVIGDGGFVFALEKRGYVKAGQFTPEAVIEHPEAVRQLHREFLRAGADVMQTFTFYASEDKLENRGNKTVEHGVFSVNNAACELAREVADEGDALVAGGLSQTPTFLKTRDEEKVKSEFRKQCQVFKKNNVDFMIVEYFEHVLECEWVIEVVAEVIGCPIMATLCVCGEGDLDEVSCEDCAVRMVQAGADIVGVNCHFGPKQCLEGVAKMKKGLEDAGLLENVYLACQPLAYMTNDVSKEGFISCSDFPFGLEARTCTRWEIQEYARQAHELGVRYIGGCCGFEPYHVRAMSEELEEERGGKVCDGSEKHDKWGGCLNMHTKPFVRERATKDYWSSHVPGTGR